MNGRRETENGKRVVVAALLFASTAGAQSLESRIANARGSVAFTYATRPSVCGDGYGISVSDDSTPGWNRRSRRTGMHFGTRDNSNYDRCETGPAQVILTRDRGNVTGLRVTVGGRAPQGDSDLGEVSPAEASRFLLDQAPKLDGKSADHAVMGAAIADGNVPWRRMLAIARDQEASESARKACVFWVSQEAGSAATAGLDSIASDNDASIGVRSDALFFLAQRENGEGIPALIRVVESSKSVKLKKDAVWFLGQSRDPRALALFEKLLTNR